MALIEEYMNGNCKISVYDDCIQDPEEVQRIIERVSRLVIGEELKRAMQEKKKVR